jgi:hypothetical protein
VVSNLPAFHDTLLSERFSMPGRHLDRYNLSAAVILTLGTLLRLALSWPAPYNDEGTVGLMALDVAYHGAHPLVSFDILARQKTGDSRPHR